MKAFYFDVGGVLIPDRFAPNNSMEVFRELAERHDLNAEAAHAIYTNLQPSLDLGVTSLSDFCAAIGVAQESFERDWLAMHPLDGEGMQIIEQLLARGHRVGLATNFCRLLLDLLIENAPLLSRLAVCCSADIGVVKPSREFFHHASTLIGSSDVVFVDDRRVNLEGARRFGWTSIEATDGWHARFKRRYLKSLGGQREA